MILASQCKRRSGWCITWCYELPLVGPEHLREADKLASLVLGEPIDWPDHGAKWEEAIEEADATRAKLDRAVRALEACSDKLESVSSAARGELGHSDHTMVVLHQARAALQSARE